MTSADAKPTAGLEGVVATVSAICYLDGPRGVLAYCGLDIHDLTTHATFEEVCYLLWHRRLPTRAELGEPMLRLMRSLPRATPWTRCGPVGSRSHSGSRPS